MNDSWSFAWQRTRESYGPLWHTVPLSATGSVVLAINHIFDLFGVAKELFPVLLLALFMTILVLLQWTMFRTIYSPFRNWFWLIPLFALCIVVLFFYLMAFSTTEQQLAISMMIFCFMISFFGLLTYVGIKEYSSSKS